MALTLFNDPFFGDMERAVSRAFQPFYRSSAFPTTSGALSVPSMHPMDVMEHKDRYSIVAGACVFCNVRIRSISQPAAILPFSIKMQKRVLEGGRAWLHTLSRSRDPGCQSMQHTKKPTHAHCTPQHRPRLTSSPTLPSTHPADAPGMTPDDVRVELQGDTLVVSGEKKTEKKERKEEGGFKMHRQERTFARFTRWVLRGLRWGASSWVLGAVRVCVRVCVCVRAQCARPPG